MEQNNKACVLTFGCLQNESDSEKIKGMLRNMGYNVTEPAEKNSCKVIVINTCAIREHAELKALSNTGQFKKFKTQNPDTVLILCGCMAEQPAIKEKIKQSYPYVDLIIGTHMLYKFPEILRGYTDSKIKTVPYELNTVTEGLPLMRDNKYRAKVSVMYGCDNFCSYCVVPYVRGRERSRAKEAVINEVKQLICEGYKEIMLLGQNVNSYKYGEKYGFPELLSDMAEIDGDFWIRFMTSHPKDLSDRLIEVIRDNPKIERHFHLPLQSGSDRILELMNRKYTREEYLKKALKLKETVSGISLTSDIIVAFPTETEKDFTDTLDMVKTLEFDNIYPFIYSKRPQTAAAKMKSGITRAETADRFKRLLELQDCISLRKNKTYTGGTERVLIDGVSKSDGKYLTGRTSSGKLVNVKGNDELIGNFVRVKIADAKLHTLYGEDIK